jgi:thaumarchaeosortase
MWKGRTFELFFVWLICLELILGWEKFKETKLIKPHSLRFILLSLTMILPTIYVGACYYLGLNDVIVCWASVNNIQGDWASAMPVSIEYLVFAAFFAMITFFIFGKKGLLKYAIPLVFIVIVGMIYVIDNMYPYGQFTLFQIFVPTTALIASTIFNLLGYSTNLTNADSFYGTMPILTVSGPMGTTQFGIAWPCAGIESFLIYTAVALLFLKRMPISWKTKIEYFTLGAVITYSINIFRIVKIFMISMQHGTTSPNVDLFHKYYGPLYSITWIVIYPLLIVLSQTLWNRHKKKSLLNVRPKD